jgi:hypothetical protein
MVILDTGHQDLILGHMWFDQLNVQLNPCLQKLIWPANILKSLNLIKLWMLNPQVLQTRPVDPGHQADVDCCDQALTDLLLSVSLVEDLLSTQVPQILKRELSQAPNTCSSEYWDQ